MPHSAPTRAIHRRRGVPAEQRVAARTARLWNVVEPYRRSDSRGGDSAACGRSFCAMDMSTDRARERTERGSRVACGWLTVTAPRDAAVGVVSGGQTGDFARLRTCVLRMPTRVRDLDQVSRWESMRPGAAVVAGPSASGVDCRQHIGQRADDCSAASAGERAEMRDWNAPCRPEPGAFP